MSCFIILGQNFRLVRLMNDSDTFLTMASKLLVRLLRDSLTQNIVKGQESASLSPTFII